MSCSVDGVSTGVKDLDDGKITSILVKTGQTTVCTFTNAGLISGDVTYTITVANTRAENVSLFSLNDDKFGNLAGVGRCQTGGTIVIGTPYTCTFTKTRVGSRDAACQRGYGGRERQRRQQRKQHRNSHSRVRRPQPLSAQFLSRRAARRIVPRRAVLRLAPGGAAHSGP